MAAAAPTFTLSRVAALSSEHLRNSRRLFLAVSPILTGHRRCRSRSSAAVACPVSCLNGGGVSSDDYFVSTQKSNLDRGLSVIANMLKRIEPLDSSVISKGVSESAKDSMKQTISTMLGLLPSDQFSVQISLSKSPLHRLLFSSIVTGYTLWNAEYRISLARNLDMCAERVRAEEFSRNEVLVEKREERESGSSSFEELEGMRPQVFGDLPPAALNYIQKLQSELSDVEQELSAQKKETLQIEYEKGNKNDLLEYLRSLDPNMVTELSRPSSFEVEEIMHLLVQNIVQRFFKDEVSSNLMGETVIGNTDNNQNVDGESCGVVGTSRDYLAKLLFWCMLLGHHLRGLENRLHLSCVVGLL